VPSPARHEWAKRISEFVLGHGPKPIAKFQQYGSDHTVQDIVDPTFSKLLRDQLSFNTALSRWPIFLRDVYLTEILTCMMLIGATWYAGCLAYMPNKGELMAMVVIILLQKCP
jgi:hypothetical protein